MPAKPCQQYFSARQAKQINDVGIGGQSPSFHRFLDILPEPKPVITNNASAEFGRAGGAVVISRNQSSCTNTYHG